MAASEKKVLNVKALLTDELTKEMGGIRKSIDKTAKATKKANKASAKSFSKVKKAVVALAVAYVSLRSIALVRNLAATTDAIGKLSIAMGETVENVSELKAAFTFAGASADAFKSVLSALLTAQRAGIKGTGDQAAIFDKLGIGMLELQKAKPVELIRKMAEGSERFATSQERTLAFQTLFPEQWRNIINLIEGGGAAFDARLEEARKAGATVTREQAKAAALITDAFFKVELAVGNVGRELLTSFGPGLIATLEAFSNVLNENKGLIVDLALTIKTVFVGAINLMADAVISVIGLIESIPGIDLTSNGKLDEEKLAIDRRLFTIGATDPGPFGQGGMGRDTINMLFAKEIKELTARLTEIAAEKARIAEGGGLAGELSLLRKEFADAIDKFASELEKSRGQGIGQKIGREIATGIGEGAEEEMPVATQGFGLAVANAINMALELADKIRESAKAGVDSFSAGWENGIKNVSEQIENLSRTLGETSARAATGTISAFSNELSNVISGAKTAKDAWKDFLQSTLKLLAQVIAKMLTMKLLNTFFGSGDVAKADGGILPGVRHDLPTHAYASGGIARRPQLAVFGEGNRAEAFVPLPDNRSIPVSFTGGGGPSSGAGMVNVNIYAWDSRDVARGLMENQDTLRGIFITQAESRNGVRQTIQRASR